MALALAWAKAMGNRACYVNKGHGLKPNCEKRSVSSFSKPPVRPLGSANPLLPPPPPPPMSETAPLPTPLKRESSSESQCSFWAQGTGSSCNQPSSSHLKCEPTTACACLWLQEPPRLWRRPPNCPPYGLNWLLSPRQSRHLLPQQRSAASCLPCFLPSPAPRPTAAAADPLRGQAVALYMPHRRLCQQWAVHVPPVQA